MSRVLEALRQWEATRTAADPFLEQTVAADRLPTAPPAKASDVGRTPATAALQPSAEPPHPRPQAATDWDRRIRAELEHPRRGPEYRRLAAALDSVRKRLGIKSLLLAAAHPGVPVADPAACVAALEAEAGRSALLVDADWRGGALTAGLKLDGRPGLCEALFQCADWRDAVAAWGAAAGVLPRGTPPREDCAADGARLRELFLQWVRHWDWVIAIAGECDRHFTPPLAAAADGVYLVLKLPAAPRAAVLSTAGAMRRAGARLLGTVAINVME